MFGWLKRAFTGETAEAVAQAASPAAIAPVVTPTTTVALAAVTAPGEHTAPEAPDQSDLPEAAFALIDVEPHADDAPAAVEAPSHPVPEPAAQAAPEAASPLPAPAAPVMAEAPEAAVAAASNAAPTAEVADTATTERVLRVRLAELFGPNGTYALTLRRGTEADEVFSTCMVDSLARAMARQIHAAAHEGVDDAALYERPARVMPSEAAEAALPTDDDIARALDAAHRSLEPARHGARIDTASIERMVHPERFGVISAQLAADARESADEDATPSTAELGFRRTGQHA